MKPQNCILGPWLLGSAHALTLPTDFDISAITRSEKSSLKWGPCDLEALEVPEELDCATLEVPLDYTGSATKDTIDLQLIRAKATKGPFKGSILYNPGGPGESGVETIAGAGQLFVKILGEQYNVIGFDPRGTGRTIPFYCNTTSAVSRRDYNHLPQADPWSYLKKEAWKTASDRAEQCFKAQEKTGRFIGTTSVARDMLSIVDALCEGPQLNYWGTSYGTALGQYFAAMFPDRVGRMVLDGNINADDYATTLGSQGSVDAEKSLVKLFSACVEAGPEACPLADYAGPNTTVKDLTLAIGDLFAELIDSPSLPPNSGLSATDFPYGGTSIVIQLKGAIIQKLYGPKDYPTAAEIVASALERNWSAIFDPSSGTGSAEAEVKWNLGTDALYGISCLDSSFRTDTPDDLYSMAQIYLVQGSFADSQVEQFLSCAQWKFNPVETFDTNAVRNSKTSFPILFVNGPYDPVTPLISAWDASSRFRGSRVLVHEGVGHGFMAHPSACTLRVVADYFVNGTMPEVGSVCEPNQSVWDYIATAAKAAGGE